MQKPGSHSHKSHRWRKGSSAVLAGGCGELRSDLAEAANGFGPLRRIRARRMSANGPGADNAADET
jgi:hypothetical protein